MIVLTSNSPSNEWREGNRRGTGETNQLGRTRSYVAHLANCDGRFVSPSGIHGKKRPLG